MSYFIRIFYFLLNSSEILVITRDLDSTGMLQMRDRAFIDTNVLIYQEQWQGDFHPVTVQILRLFYGLTSFQCGIRMNGRCRGFLLFLFVSGACPWGGRNAVPGLCALSSSAFLLPCRVWLQAAFSLLLRGHTRCLYRGRRVRWFRFLPNYICIMSFMLCSQTRTILILIHQIQSIRFGSRPVASAHI